MDADVHSHEDAPMFGSLDTVEAFTAMRHSLAPAGKKLQFTVNQYKRQLR